jgi:ribosome-associated translation inhibitor RaiA
MNAVQTAPVQVEALGRVPDAMRGPATVKVGSLLRFASEPVLSARVTLAVSAGPAVPRPTVAQATIDPNGRIVRAQAAGEDMSAAVEHMAARLRVRLDRLARDWPGAARHAPGPRARPVAASEHPAHRPGYFPRPADGNVDQQQPGPAPLPGHLERDRHAAARQAEHDDLGTAQVPQPPGQVPSGIRAVHEQHLRHLHQSPSL